MNFKQIIKCVIVTKFEKKTTALKNTEMWVGRVLTNVEPTKVVTMLCFEPDLGVKLLDLEVKQIVGLTCMMANYSSALEEENQVKSTRSSKLYTSTVPFVYDESVINSYRNGKLTSFEEVKQSPVKRRVSIQGEVTGIEIYDTPAHKRQILHLEDEKKQVLDVTVWNNHIQQTFQMKEMVVLRNVEVSEFLSTKKLKSTFETTVETQEEETKITFVIDCVDENDITTESGKEYHVFEGANMKELVAGTKIEAILNGKKIIDYRIVDES